MSKPRFSRLRLSSTMPPVSNRWKVAIFCVAVAYLTLFYKLGNLAFVGADEPRYARVGEEMSATGAFVTPTLNFKPWLEKPPLLFWMEAGTYRLTGVSEGSARLPAAILALLAAVSVALLAGELAGSQAGILSFLILLTTALYFVFGRAASTDMPLTSCLTIAMCAGFKATRSRALRWGLLWGLPLALAVLAKGPVALLLFTFIFFLYFVLLDEFLWNWRQTLLGVMVLVVTGLPWFWEAWRQNGSDFVITFLINHNLARFISNLHHHSQPVWYYLPVLLIGGFPWILFLGASLTRTWRAGRKGMRTSALRGQLFLWIWLLLPLLLFSASVSKLPGYVLPCIPPLAVLAGLEWDRYLKGDLVAYRAMRWQLAATSSLAVVLALTLIVVFQLKFRSGNTGLLIALPLAGGVILAQFERRKRRPLGTFLSLVGGMTLFCALTYWKAAPVIEPFYSARQVCRLAQPLISARNPLILYRYFDHTALYYSNYQATPEPLNDKVQLQAYLSSRRQRDYYLLTKKRGWEDLAARKGTRLVRQVGNLYLVEINPNGDEVHKKAGG